MGVTVPDGDVVKAAGADAFRAAMRRLGAHVCIVSAGEGDSLTGMTVTSLSSLSVDPPAIAVSINRSASIHTRLQPAEAFAVSGLTREHLALANRFAGRDGVAGAERFDQGDWRRLPSGALALSDATFVLDCRVAEIIEWHSHSIVIGKVELVRIGPSDALMYADGGYRALGLIE